MKEQQKTLGKNKTTAATIESADVDDGVQMS